MTPENLAAEIVAKVRASDGESAINLETMVANMIRQSRVDYGAWDEYRQAFLKAVDELGVWKHAVESKDRQLNEFAAHCNTMAEYSQKLESTLDDYGQTHPDVLSAVEAAMKDLNQFRIKMFEARDKHNKITEFIARFLIAYRVRIYREWLDGFVECGAVTIDWNSNPYGEVKAVKLSDIPLDAKQPNQ